MSRRAWAQIVAWVALTTAFLGGMLNGCSGQAPQLPKSVCVDGYCVYTPDAGKRGAAGAAGAADSTAE